MVEKNKKKIPSPNVKEDLHPWMSSQGGLVDTSVTQLEKTLRQGQTLPLSFLLLISFMMFRADVSQRLSLISHLFHFTVLAVDFRYHSSQQGGGKERGNTAGDNESSHQRSCGRVVQI